MKKSNTIKPEDILPDGVDHTFMDGRLVRKGTIAAFIANIEIIEDVNSSDLQQQNAFAMLKTLAKDVVAIGLHRHVVFRNKMVEQLFSQV